MNTKHILTAREIADAKQIRQGLVDILKTYTETKKQLEQIAPEVATCFHEDHDSTMQQASRAISAIDNATDAKTPLDQIAWVFTMRRELMLLDGVLGVTSTQVSMMADVLTATMTVLQPAPGICEIRFSYPDEAN